MGNQQASLSLMPVPFAEKYFITSDGRVFSTNRGSLKELKQSLHYGKSKSPYLRVKANGVYYLSHRLIASVLIGRELKHDEVINHKDGNTLNNNLINLEIVTHKENVRHAVTNNLYCSGEAWHKAREASTTISKESTPKRGEAVGGQDND